MGVSPASAVSTALNLFQILSLPMGPQELDRDLAKINKNMHELVPKLFNGYDRSVVPVPNNGGPVEVKSFLLVDHIEELNEFQQTLNFHGTLILMWLDARLSWEPEDYGQLGSLAFSGFDLTRFWQPAVTIKGVTMPSRQLAMFHNTVYTLKSSGIIIAELSISVKAACRIDLSTYPYDNQTCFVFVFTPSYPSSRVTFSATSAMLTRESLYSTLDDDETANDGGKVHILNTTMAGGFELVNLDAQRFFAYSKGFTLNESEAEPFSALTNTVLRYQIRLRRRIGSVYLATVSMPLFCITMVSFLAISVPNARFSLLMLKFSIAALMLLLLQNDRMTKTMPGDFDSEPFCAPIPLISSLIRATSLEDKSPRAINKIRFSRLMLLQFAMLLIYRIWLIFETDRLIKEQHPKFVQNGDDPENDGILSKWTSRIRPSTLNGLRQFESAVNWALMAETLLNFWLLFF